MHLLNICPSFLLSLSFTGTAGLRGRLPPNAWGSLATALQRLRPCTKAGQRARFQDCVTVTSPWTCCPISVRFFRDLAHDQVEPKVEVAQPAASQAMFQAVKRGMSWLIVPICHVTCHRNLNMWSADFTYWLADASCSRRKLNLWPRPKLTTRTQTSSI